MKTDQENHYLDGFALPVPRAHLEPYRAAAEKIAGIWKEHGALAYFEYAGDELSLDGTRSFPEILQAEADEVVIFGWTVFESREARDRINKLVAEDPRMSALVTPLTHGEKVVFDAQRMVFGGFRPLVYSPER